MGMIDFGGAAKEACLEYVPDAKVDDYVAIHVGFAINTLDEHEAREGMKLIKESLDSEV